MSSLSFSLYLFIHSISSVAQSCLTFGHAAWTTACQASISITNSWSLLKLMSVELVMPSNHFILCRLLLLLPSVFPSIRESVLPRWWPKYWSFSFSISSSNEYSGLISFRMDWFDPFYYLSFYYFSLHYLIRSLKDRNYVF